METSIYRIISIGVNQHGNSVIRVMLPSRQIVEVATNVIGFAKLASAGVAVDNDHRANVGKAG